MEKKIRVMVVGDMAGSGARDHAVVEAFAESPLVERAVWVSPNAAVRHMDNVSALNLRGSGSVEEYIDSLVAYAQIDDINLTFVASEAWLYAGIVDRFEAEGLPIIGPSRKAALFTEGSKDFCKHILGMYGIPTASYFAFSNRESARAYLETYMAKPGASCVIKADGPARGKGVGVAHNIEDACREVDRIWDLVPGGPILVEEYIPGWELSYIVAVDGAGNIVPLVPVQDYKDFGGRMTGGMGARTVPELSQELRGKIDNEVVRPTIDAFRNEGIPYQGFLYFGLMIVGEKGRETPYVLELNCRLGDPEAQIILSCLESDYAGFCIALLGDRLDTMSLEWSNEQFVAIVLAAAGYPGDSQTGDVVYGLEEAEQEARVYYAGLRVNDNGELVTAGGRVLTVVCSGACFPTSLVVKPERNNIALRKAREKAYAAARKISFGDPDPKLGTQVFLKSIADRA